MREYAKLAPTLWTGETGKALRKKGPEALIVAVYLMSSPHSNMLGLYYQPVMYMAHETGLGIEGASKGLLCCIEASFCSYDADTEMVYVHEMAAYQIGAALSSGDKRCKGIQKDYDALPSCPFLASWFDRYCADFNLTTRRENKTKKLDGTEAPSMPHRSQEQEQEQEQEFEEANASSSSAEPTEAGQKKARTPNTPFEEIVALYHEVLPELPKIRVMDDDRKKLMAGLWKFVLTSKKSDGTPRATNESEALLWVRGYFERTRDNDFVMNRTARSEEHKNWRANLDYLCTSRGMKQVIEKTETAA